MAPWPSISPFPSKVKLSTQKNVRRLAACDVQMLFGATMLPSICRLQVQIFCPRAIYRWTQYGKTIDATCMVIGDLQGH
uniref:Uncharacterized protein n=1 Tax=Arundo donax TaxID=35708 RepID=A0A0A9AM74_ARUDO